MQTKRMKTGPQDPKLRIDLGGTIGKNPLGEQLVRPMYKFAKLVIEISSKVQEPKTYNKTINDSILENKW